MGSFICGNREVFTYHIDNSEYYDFYVEGGYETIPYRYEDNTSKTTLSNNRLEITNNISPLKSDKVIDDYGYHGLDNGSLRLRFDQISNSGFIKKVREHKGTLYKDKVVLEKVDTNTSKYKDLENSIIENEDKSISFKGSYYQGIFGDEDDVLLKYLIENKDFSIRLKLNPKFSEYNESSVNLDYPENKGTFFYIGPRSESKLLDGITLKDNLFNKLKEEDCETNYFPSEYIKYECSLEYVKDGCSFGKTYIGDNEYVKGDYFNNVVDVPSYFKDDYISDDYNKRSKVNKYTTSDYFKPDVKLENVFGLNKNDFCDRKIKRLKTDNKYLLFSRSCRDYNVNKWQKDKADKIEHYIEFDEGTDENKFLTFNRSCKGLNVESYKKKYACSTKSYSVVKDLHNNAFSLLANTDGSISYRYLTSTCDKDKEYEIKEGSTLPKLLKEDVWSDVRVTIKHIVSGYDGCGKPIIDGFKIWVYIDGFLKYVSNKLPTFKFRKFDLKHRYQSGLPYNISVGGGTLGLSNKVDLNNNVKVNEDRYYVDKHFNGVYMGGMRDFQIYPEPDNILNLRIKNTQKRY